MTELIRGLHNIKIGHQGCVVTIGNFDGVHLGHKALIKEVLAYAKRLNVPAVVVTFEPQPLEFFKGTQGVARLTRWREKYIALSNTGIDYVLVLRFDQKLADLSAEDFVKTILCDKLNVKQVIVGDDFCFGKQRQGNFELLSQLGKLAGFKVASHPSVMHQGERVSSTRIRQALAQEDNTLAEQLLGQPYSMIGRVVHGNKLGRQLGFPTANIYLHRAVTPVAGIYIVRMHGLADKALPGVANVGVRPTIGGTRTLLEVYLFNFNQDIYGREVRVEFCEKIRAEERYANLELLQEAIANDADKARHYFIERGEL